MEKSKMLMTVYANKPMRELSNEEGIALSDVIESFYKSIGITVIDVALEDVSEEITAKSISMYLSL